MTDTKTLTPPIGGMELAVSCLRAGQASSLYQAFVTHCHTKLSFPKHISAPPHPPREVSLGIMAYLWRIKRMFLTDWPLHLFPGVTLITMPSFTPKHLRKKMFARHFQESRPSLALLSARVIFKAGDMFAHVRLSLSSTIRYIFLKILIHSSTRLIMRLVFKNFPYFEDGNYRQRECRQFPVAELLICRSLMSRSFNQARREGKKKKKDTSQYVLSELILLLLLLLSRLSLIKGHSVSWPH